MVVVTDGYHLPRALYTFRRLGMPVQGAAAATPKPLLLGTRCREMAAFAVYLWRVGRCLRR